MQSQGFYQRCAKSHVGPLESSHFESAILGNAIYLMSVGGHFRYKFKRNCLKHMTVISVVEGCPWKVHTFRNEHNLFLEDVLVSEPVVRCNRATTMIDDVIRSNPDYLPRQICKDFHQQYIMQLNYCVPQCSYKLLPWLCTRLIETNPGTITEYRCLDDGHFMQLFVALSVSIHRFKMGCQPIILINSSHMSGPYKGALFSTSSYDADDGMFPLAYGLFSSENYKDWLWFLEKLKMVIGIIRSVLEVFGSENHAHCYRHIKENFSNFLTKLNTKERKWKENVLQILDSITYARLHCDYEVVMDTLRTFNHDLAKWVEDNNPQHWVISKFKKMRWDKMTSNLVESFNSWLRHERHHNICVFFIEHMDKLGSLLVEYKNGLVKWNGCIGENYITYLHLGSLMKVSNGKTFLEVDLMKRTCTCKAWQMSGTPCDHACAIIWRMGFDVSDYVDDWYKYNLQEKIYSGNLRTLVTHDMPMIDEDGIVRDALDHTHPFLNLLTTKRPPGRPRKCRIESQFIYIYIYINKNGSLFSL
ncbi:hypothetical protein AAG906_006904 [Vitis piasezkii]